MKQRTGSALLLLVAVGFPVQCSLFEGEPSMEPELIQTGGTPVVDFAETSSVQASTIECPTFVSSFRQFSSRNP
jgi:hypothetical protein